MQLEPVSPFIAKQALGMLGASLLWVGLIAALVTVATYLYSLKKSKSLRVKWFARTSYTISALSVLGVFGALGAMVYGRQYQYSYVFSHTGNDLHGWFRLAAMWSAQEGSFLLWSAWTAIIGFMVLARAGKYESRVMPVYVTILAFLCAIIIKQSPFLVVPAPSAADLLANPGWHYPPMDGRGLTPSLVNYWMTIHPPTIFFGFASLAVPFCYAIAALIWKDYDGWMGRVMPYSLLSCATLGIGLFMGGYWAYETQGWHGFWAWDPVENASFFPWLAITALVHGAVVQKSRGGMGRTNTFLGIFAFWLFLLGTFLTRSGALSGKDAQGQMLSVHAFDNIGKSALFLMVAMMLVYGIGGLLLWLFRLRTIPVRPVSGETLVSRDFAFFMAVTLMVIACFVVMLGTTTPLTRSWMHKPPFSPPASFYNMFMLPISILTAFLLGCVPWLAWKKTNPDTFRKKLIIPWMIMIVFGFSTVFWVQSAERNSIASHEIGSTVVQETLRAWINPSIQRIAVVSLASLGFLAALSNAMLAYKVFRAKPLAAGGWLAHVGIGLLMIGVVVSNTYERTERITLQQGDNVQKAFGYQFAFEKMTGKPMSSRPLNPDYDRENAIQIRITPPLSEIHFWNPDEKTYLSNLKWFVHNISSADSEKDFERMRWPDIIKKSFGHDLYIGVASDPGYKVHAVTLKPMEHRDIGPYSLMYVDQVGEPGKYMGANILIKTADGKVIQAQPGLQISQGDMNDANVAIPELKFEDGNSGEIKIKNINPGTKEATFLISLPGYAGEWEVPLEVTFKPWVNLVWIGVLIATSGTLLAMTRRVLESRKISDTVPSKSDKLSIPERESWEVPTAEDSSPSRVPSVSTIPAVQNFDDSEKAPPKSRKRKLNPSS